MPAARPLVLAALVLGAGRADAQTAPPRDATRHAVERAVVAAFQQEQKLTAVDADTEDELGYAVALDGDRALVAANLDDHDGGTNAGAVYVFEFDGTTWTETATLTAIDAATGDQFGSAVALDGDRAVVGAPEDHHGSPSLGDAGSAYVFEFDGTAWTETAKLTASDASALDHFATSVAIAGDVVLVGTPVDNHPGPPTVTDAGSVYIFVYDGTTWSQQTRLTASAPGANAQFGQSVDFDGSRALIGAGGADGGAGAVYVLDYDGTTWTEEARLTAGDAAANDAFGTSVALSGGRALVGAPFDDYGVYDNVGAAYVFAFDGATWAEETKLTATERTQNDEFGRSVALDGDRALAGAALDDEDIYTSVGAVYVFERDGAAWAEEARLLTSDFATGDRLGWAVALDGDRALAGAYGDDRDGLSNAGAAYVFAVVAPPTVALAAGEGWRMLAPPAGGQTVGSFLGPIHTQGFAGSDAGTAGTPTVYAYVEAEGDYAAPASAAEAWPVGTGRLVYVFADDPATPEPDDGLPATLTADGPLAEAPFTFALSRTPGNGEPAGPGWNLLGNPFDQAIDWDDAGWTKTAVSNSVYVYDPAFNGGDYRFWNGSEGTLDGGVIPAGNGFWVEATGPGASLVVPATARAGAPPPYGRQPGAAAVVALRLDGVVGGVPLGANAFVAFQDGGADGRDGRDAVRLASLAGRSLVLGSAALGGAGLLALDAREAGAPEAGPVEVPLAVAALDGGAAVGAALTLSWPRLDVPAGWQLSLRDLATGAEVDLRAATSYAFETEAGGGGAAGDGRPAVGPASGETRFVLRVASTATAGDDGAPSGGPSLDAVYPNPTTGAVAVRFALPDAGEVTVEVLDVLGRRVAVAAVGTRGAGVHHVRLDATGLPAGAYVVRLVAAGGVRSRPLTIAR